MLTPENVAALMALLGVTLYGVFGGADFGAGIWEFNLLLSSPPKERKLINRAIGPVWEANHVWLIFVIVILFTAFPPAYAGICRALWLPLLLALAGIVFRGVGFVFRSYASEDESQEAVWSGVFALASTAAPFFLGGALGALASGTLPLNEEGALTDTHPLAWLSPLSLFSAFTAVGLCAFLAAVFLTREALQAGAEELAETWRRRALTSGVWMGGLAMAGLALMYSSYPELWERFSGRSWPLVLASVASGGLALGATASRRRSLAAGAAALAVAAILLGWGVAQFPLIVPPHLTVESSKAPSSVLWATIGIVTLGTLVLVPSLAFLIALFKTDAPPLDDPSA